MLLNIYIFRFQFSKISFLIKYISKFQFSILKNIFPNFKFQSLKIFFNKIFNLERYFSKLKIEIWRFKYFLESKPEKYGKNNSRIRYYIFFNNIFHSI